MNRLKHSSGFTAAPTLFVLLWSSGFISAKMGASNAEPFTFLCLRFAFVLALMLPLALVWKARWPESPGEIGHIATAGLLLQAGYLGGSFAALHLGMSAGLIALIVGLQPVLTALAVKPLLGEAVTTRQWLGLLLGLGGVALVVWERVNLNALGALSIAWSVVSLVSITAGTLYQKRFCPAFDIRTGSVIQFGASLLIMVPLMLLTEDMRVDWNGETVFALAWSVLVLSIGAISLLFALINRGDATRVTSLFYLTPAVTAAMAWALFGDKLTWLSVAGMLVCITGVVIVTRSGIRRPT